MASISRNTPALVSDPVTESKNLTIPPRPLRRRPLPTPPGLPGLRHPPSPSTLPQPSVEHHLTNVRARAGQEPDSSPSIMPVPMLSPRPPRHRATHPPFDRSHHNYHARFRSAGPLAEFPHSSYNDASASLEMGSNESAGMTDVSSGPLMKFLGLWQGHTDSKAPPSCDTDVPPRKQPSVLSENKAIHFVDRTLQSIRTALDSDSWFIPGQDVFSPIHSLSNLRALLTADFREETEVHNNGLIVETIGEHPVGLGGYSDVWKGRMKRYNDHTYSLVAIKVLRQFGGKPHSQGLSKQLQQEVRIWKLLDHESIAGFHGVMYNPNGAPALISPWYANCSADVYLERNPHISPIKLIWEIILGVEYLHQHDVVHGDLKGSNVMVDDTGHAKLIDFGLSRLIDSATGATGLTISTVSSSIRWCAPELVLSDNAQVTKATDVYACASTALQLLTGEVPYSSQRERTVLLKVMNKVPPPRPSTPPRCSAIYLNELWALLEQCWTEASRRPSVSELKDYLRIFRA